MIRKLHFVLIILFFTLTYGQQSGTPDESYGTNGAVITNIGRADVIAQGQALQQDGKIIIVGKYYYNGYSGFIQRVNSDGTLDTAFGIQGWVEVESIAMNVVKLQPDGKILVGGANETLMRLNADGSLDTSFGDGGIITFPLNDDHQIVDIAIQQDLKILALSNYNDTETGDHDFKITRYSSTGTYDNTFSSDGKVITDMGGQDKPRNITVQNDGRIIVGGDSSTDTAKNFFTARYLSTGALDATFGTAGKKLIAYSASTYTVSMGTIVQPDGKMICAGKYVAGLNGTYMYAIRLTVAGAIDSSFGGSSGVTLLLPQSHARSTQPGRAKLDAMGRLVIADFVIEEADINFFESENIRFYRFTPSGAFDPSFGSEGSLTMNFYNGRNNFSDFNFNGNQIIASGNTQTSYLNTNIAIAALTENGSYDTTFSNDGMAFFTRGYIAPDKLYCSTIQPDGKLLTGGTSYINGLDLMTLVRYNADGSIDTSFGSSGRIVYPIFGAVYALAVDSNGKILVGGHDYRITLFRLNSNGSYDSDFGTGGFMNFGFDTYFSQLQDIVIQPNGKILIAGGFVDWSVNPSPVKLSLARLNSNGSYDNTFGTNGIAINNSTQTDGVINSIKLLPNGKIIACAEVYSGEDNDIAVLKFNSNGTPDNSFNGNGFASYGNIGWDYCHKISVQSDNKIVVAAELNESQDGYSVIRFMPDGSLDTGFGTSGVSTQQIRNSSYIASLHVMSNDKILLSGTSYSDTDSAMTVARLNDDGSPDISFGSNGSAFIAVGSAAQPSLFQETNTSMVVIGNNILLSGIRWNSSVTEQSDFVTVNMILDSPLTRDDFSASVISFYPNPAMNKITFSDDVLSATLNDMQGKIIPLRLASGQMDISSLAEGVYIVTVTTESGAVQKSKLIKK